jgi:hypothetical protein
MSAFRELQVAVVQALKHDGTLSVLITDVYDMAAPQGANIVPPYIVIDSWTETPMDRVNGFGVRVTFMLHIWTDYRGTKQSAAIASILEDTLHQGQNNVVLDADSLWSVVTMRRTEHTTMMDGNLCHGMMRVQATMHKRAR